jgi:hypothetical protein
MRLSHILSSVAAAATLLVTGVAAAQEERSAKSGGGTSEAAVDADVEPGSYADRKKWWVGSTFETNRTLLQQDVGGRIKAFNTLALKAGYDFTKADRVSVTGGFIQRFIAYQTETGIRADDLDVSYSHTFSLPWKLRLIPKVGDAIPISYYSQLMGLIALPRASLRVGRTFLDDTLNVSFVGGGGYYVVRYKEPIGVSADIANGGVNPRASTNIGFDIGYRMPFHRNLQVACAASTSWSWSYNPDHSNDPTLAEQFKNTPVTPSADPNYPANPPGQQRYAGSVEISYDLPSIVGIQSTFGLALSQGDGVLRDGATHLYWLSRRGGQMAAALVANY